MLSINGIPLDNANYGWRLKVGSQPIPELGGRLTTLRAPGRHGVIPIPADIDAAILPIVVRTPRDNLESLLALVGLTGVLSPTADSTREVAYEALPPTINGVGSAQRWVNVTFRLRLWGAFWRDASESTTDAVSLSSASVVTTFWSGMSAPVQDAIVRVKGANTTLRVEDSAGSWFSYGEALGGTEYLRFESETGEAFLTTSDTWTGGTDVSGDIDFGGDRGVFEITPKLGASDPTTRSAELTVTTATRTSSSIQVRGRSAYLVF